MKHSALMALVGAGFCAVVLLSTSRQAAAEPDTWSAYLDYAYVYSSADGDALRARLAEYGREAGVELDDYIAQRFDRPQDSKVLDEAAVRREAIARLLYYLASGDADSLEKSVDAVRKLQERLDRHENRYWYHYILAHHALEKGHQYDFMGEILELWLRVVLPLEGPYETLQALSLSDAPNSGFVSALPYVFENIARIVLIRSQEMGMRELDAVASVVRMLNDGRIGAHPDVIPVAASSKEYLDRIISRLDGPESDGGSLTFTLSLFEASKYHDRARSLLASEGFSADTLKAIRVATGAYESTLDRANTVQGQTAVYTRVLRQLGEVYAAKQRLGVDPVTETPFSIEGAIDVYTDLEALGEKGWAELGDTGVEAYVAAMQGLWEEIQESSLNGADYYLARAVAEPHKANDRARSAARIYSRYLMFFKRYTVDERHPGVPDSAYFAAYEAARGFGDAFLVYAAKPTPAQVDLATQRYRSALGIFPFDRRLWPDLTEALERHGRESEYLSLVQPVADSVATSRAVDTWIQNGEPGASQIETLRSALSDSQVIMYLGFAGASGTDDLEQKLSELRARRRELESNKDDLMRQRRSLAGTGSSDAPPASPAASGGSSLTRQLEIERLDRKLNETSSLLAKVDKQLAAASRSLPLYTETTEIDGLIDALRAQRDHPVHTLLRRMYHENHS